MKTKELKIDDEFKNLIPPLTEEEFNGLKESLIKEGCRDPLVLWNDVLLDGHNRYKICTENNIIFSRVEKNFDNRDKAKIWILENQLGRRNLIAAQRIDIVDKLFGLMVGNDAKQRQVEHGKTAPGKHKNTSGKSSTSDTGKARDKLGKKAKVSGRTYEKGVKVKQTDPNLWQKCLDGDISINKATRDINTKERDNERQKRELPNDVFNVFYADPPWKYNDYCEEGGIQANSAEKKYNVMTIKQLCELDIKKMADKNSVLFLWTTSPMLEDSFEVINSWGFKYKASFVWDKIKHNMGHYNSVRHEFLLVCIRGSFQPEVLKLFDSVVSVEKTRHSEKPEIFREMIDELYPHGKKIELFARKETEGWTAWGDELLQ